jgi:hypothetical protein
MIRASKLSQVLDNIRGWYLDRRPLLDAEEILGVKPGTILVFFRENAMLDASDNPGPNQTPQDFINVTLLYLSLLALARSKKRF